MGMDKNKSPLRLSKSKINKQLKEMPHSIFPSLGIGKGIDSGMSDNQARPCRKFCLQWVAICFGETWLSLTRTAKGEVSRKEEVCLHNYTMSQTCVETPK